LDKQPRSPVPGVGLEGYASEVSVAPGDRHEFMAGGPPGPAQVSLARLIHGDPSPHGPGHKEEPLDWGQPKSVEVREQFIDFGSYVEIPHAEALNLRGSFTLALWYWPTLLSGGWHTLAAKWHKGDLSYGLYCAGNRLLTAAISFDGVTAQWSTGRDFVQLRSWQFAALTYDPEAGLLSLHQMLKGGPGALDTGSSGTDALVTSSRPLAGGHVYAGRAPLLFGALPEADHPGRHWAHFNGKIGHPALFDVALDRDRLTALAGGEAPERIGHVLGCWDFGLEVSSTRVVDLSPYGNHGRAVNAPGRAVSGPRWSGSLSRRYTDNPENYNAVHFHEDDLEDAHWEIAFDVTVPAEARSGIYAAQLERGADRLFIPFIVRPREPRSELAVLIPTLTWQAYSSNRAPYSYSEDGLIDRGLCHYDTHRDGSMVYYVTRRRPTRAWLPGAAMREWGAHNLTADLYLLDWLETKGYGYDAFADHDLHREGFDLLRRYGCLILSSHPEYWTGPMLDALALYVRRGGRVLYLGGNGLYWVTTFDPERPHLIEVRKSGEGDYGPAFAPEPGEIQHSTTLEVGGLWARRGRPARSLVGIEFSANMFQPAGGGWGFERLSASFDPRFAFAFEGIGRDEVIGDFGLNLGTAAGFEMDSVQEWQWDKGTPEPVVLARASHPWMFPPARVPAAPVAEVTLMDYPGGGAVFAAGSVTWTGSLSHNGYDNNVSRLTENVLRRFLSAPAGGSVTGANR
jgi:N,N-dimethylformamidase